MDNYKIHSMQIIVEKGLQSPNLAEVMTTITECARYIREFPFPHFVHNTLFQLAKAFHGDMFARKFEHSMNAIRLRIVTAVRECSGSLSLAFSDDEIVRCIMKVSHSNEPYARSLTLLFLASLATLVCEDKKIHNLVIESLDCTARTELMAAIHAANELAKYSLSFSALIIRKIAEMLGQTGENMTNSIKIELFAIISNLRDLSMADHCMQLGRAQLKTTADDKMHAIIYCSLTHLARRCEAILPDQISLLLAELQRNISKGNKCLVHCILENLPELAAQQQYWSDGQVMQLNILYPSIRALNSKGILCNWLHCLEVLSSTGTLTRILIEKHPWTELLHNQDIVVRIFAIKVSLNLIQTGADGEGKTNQFNKNALLESILATLLHFIANPKTHSRIVGRLRREFLSLVSNFVRSPKCSPEFASTIVNSVLQAELHEECSDLFMLLAVITDTHWGECRQIVSSSLLNSLAREPNMSKVPSIVFTLLFSTMSHSLFDDEQSGKKLAELTHQLLAQPHNHWHLYLVARSALRFGHWKRVAAPILQRIRKSCENMETQSWIAGLLRIAKSQPTSFSVDEIANFGTDLQHAALKFKLLASAEKDQPFSYAADYVNCLHSTYRTIHSILTLINVKLLENAMERNETYNQQQTTIQSLDEIRPSVVEAKQQWVALCSRSFDADTQTLLQMGLMIRMCLLLEQFLAILCDEADAKNKQKISEIPIEDLGESTKNNFQPNAQTRNFHALLNWVRGELLAFHSADTNLLNNLKVLREMLFHLVNFRLGLPRFFFQRVQHTRIKLIINPQPSEGRNVFRVSSAELLPLTVEGIIESTNAKVIDSVCVVLTMKRENTAPTEKKQMVKLEPGQRYFQAQFLLKIHQRTKINAKVWFEDAVTKKQWFDESDMVGLTVELLDGTSNAAAQQQTQAVPVQQH